MVRMGLAPIAIHVFYRVDTHFYRLSLNRFEQINIGEFIFRFYHILKNFTVSDCGRLHQNFLHQMVSIIRLYGIVEYVQIVFASPGVGSTNVNVVLSVATHTQTAMHSCSYTQRVSLATKSPSHTQRHTQTISALFTPLKQMMKIFASKEGFPVALEIASITVCSLFLCCLCIVL